MVTLSEKQLSQDALNFRPKKFLMWLFVITSFMLFAALTSGYIVYTGGSPSRGLKMILPSVFIYSTLVIILSSVSLVLAQRAGKALAFVQERLWLGVTIALGLLFCMLQYAAWQEFIARGVYFVNPNASQSFLYVFTGAHMLHVFGGLAMLVHALWRNTRNTPQVKNLFNLELTSILWHALCVLWIYLYMFLLLNQ